MKLINKVKNIDFVINSILIATIILNLCLSIYMLFVNRTLFLDEAMFAWSFSQRNLINLTTSAFEWVQIGPIIYIYIVKIITLILGNSEITLRLFSVISYILLIILVYKCSKNIFKMKYALIPTAFLASLGFVLKYSNEFKVYIFDGVVVLFVFYMYYLYKEKKIDFKKLILIFMISIWASNPVCFLIGGIFLYEFILALKAKNWKYIRSIIIGAIFAFISFAIYYFYWLRPVSSSASMQNMWKYQHFPLIPKNMADLKKMKDMFFEIIAVFNNNKLIIVLMSILSLVIGIFKKNNFKIILTFTILITLVASYIKMFPVEDRMCFFIYPILIMLCFDTLMFLINDNKISKYIILSICAFLIASNIIENKYWNKDNIYLDTEEVNDVINYLDNNIKSDEKIYVHYRGIAPFQYKNGYYNNSLKNHGNEVLFGTGGFYNGLKVSEIVNENNIYIFTQHYVSDLQKEMNALTSNGYLELIINPHKTPLYYYTKDINRLRTKVLYEIVSTKIEGDDYILSLSIKNIGDTIINHSNDNIYLTSRNNLSIKFPLSKYLNKEESCVIKLKIDFKKYDEIALQLYNENNYWFDELGIEPIIINKNMFK